MKRKTIITCAVTGAGDTVGKHPAIPVTPEQIANAAIGARNAGAAVAHIHVRDPKTGLPSQRIEYYREVVERIRGAGCDILVNLTTGAGARFIPDDKNPAIGGPGTTLSLPLERVAHVADLKPQICSLDVGSMNFGERVFVNTPEHLRTMAAEIKKAGVKPELEVFEPGHVLLARKMISDGDIDEPPMFQVCLGIPWGSPASANSMLHMRSLLPPNAIWSAFGIGRAEFPMVAQAVILGGHVRVGLEDNLYVDEGVFATDNAALVTRAVEIVKLLGAEVATPGDAKDLLEIA